MAINIYKLKKWMRMMKKASIEHVNQGVGKAYSISEVKGYYNDLTQKVLKGDCDVVIPTFRTERGDDVYFPIQIFQYGLGAFDLFLLGKDNDMKNRFKACADWALYNQQENGAYDTFFFDSPQSPYSAMAQGEGVSLLIRAYLEFDNSRYLIAAKKAIAFMKTSTNHGGTALYVGDDVYLKEFTHKPTVLNGWIFSLFGLFDYLKIQHDEQIEAIFLRSIKTMAKQLNKFDNGYWSKYNCESLIASPFYHRLHIALLKVLYEITGEEAFKDFYIRWQDYENNTFLKTKAFIIKAAQKLFEKNQTASEPDHSMKVTQIMPEFALAGAEIMAENLCVTLKQRGCCVSAVSLFHEHTAITRRMMLQHIPVFFLDKKSGLDLRMIIRLYRIFKKNKPNVVHTHRYVLPYVIPAAIFAKVSVRVHTVHNIASRELDIKHRKLNRFFYKHCRVVPVAISPRVKQTVMDEYELPDDQVPVIFNGIDLKKIPIKNNYDYLNGSPILLHIGRFSKQKNHDCLIESFKLVHDQIAGATLKLIGTGDIQNRIMEKVKSLGLSEHVEFLGIKPDVSSYLCEADIFILPSLWEGMPITLIEAMAAGLPIVATRVGGVPDMIEHGKTGLLVEVTAEQISQAILKLIKDKALRRKLGMASKLASEKFSAQQMAKQYSLIYRGTSIQDVK